MKIYLASNFSLVEKVKLLADYLEDNGHEIIVKWWTTDFKKALGEMTDAEWYKKPEIKEISDRNFKGIDCADLLIIVASGIPQKFIGANIEVGYAIAKGKPVFSFGNLERSGMYHQVLQHNGLTALMESLDKLNIKVESAKIKTCPKCFIVTYREDTDYCTDCEPSESEEKGSSEKKSI